MPRLRPQIRRADRDALLDDLRAAAAIEPVDAKRFYRAHDRVKGAAFYLTAEQCDEVNRLVEEHWDRRRAAGAQMWIHETPIRPNSKMAEEYLLD